MNFETEHNRKNKLFTKGLKSAVERLWEKERKQGGSVILQRNGQIETISFGKEKSNQ
jgi:hypothetical protein